MPLLNVFSVRKVSSEQKKKKLEVNDSADGQDEEYQLPSLHRIPVLMTPELERRREEERLQKQYHLLPLKKGTYL